MSGRGEGADREMRMLRRSKGIGVRKGHSWADAAGAPEEMGNSRKECCLLIRKLEPICGVVCTLHYKTLAVYPVRRGNRLQQRGKFSDVYSHVNLLAPQ